MRFATKQRLLKTLYKFCYGLTYNAVLAMGLCLTFMEILNFVQGKTDDEADTENATNNLLIYFGLMLAFVGGFSNTSFMLENWAAMENENTLGNMTAGQVGKAVLIATPPALVALAGVYEFLDTQLPSKLLTSNLTRGLYSLVVLSAMPGEFFTYGPGLLEAEKRAWHAIANVFKHPKLRGKIGQKLKYSGLLVGQILSNISDNLPEIFAIKEITKTISNTFGLKNYSTAGLILGSVIAVLYAGFDANNEIGAVFREIVENLDQANIDESAPLNAEEDASMTIKHFSSTPPNYKLGVNIIANTLTGINCACYMTASSLILSLAGSLSNDKIPFTAESHPHNYRLLNSLLLAIPLLSVGSFSAYGQWKTINSATKNRVNHLANGGVRALISCGMWRPTTDDHIHTEDEADFLLSDLEIGSDITSALLDDHTSVPQYGRG